MSLEALTPALIPTALIAVLGFLAKDKISSIASSISALVAEVKELRKEIAEIAVLQVRIDRCEQEIGSLREQVRILETRPLRAAGGL